jgi:hypothetical protein
MITGSSGRNGKRKPGEKGDRIGVPLAPGLLSTPVYALDAEGLVLYYTFDPSVN